jgi:PAS domain S-box-containing protein
MSREEAKVMNKAKTSEQMPPQPMLATLLNNLPGMAYHGHYDGQRTMLFVSRGCLDLTGFQPEDLVDSQTIAYEDLILPEDRTAVAQEIAAAIAEDRPYLFTYRLMTASGQQRWVLDKGEAVISVDGTVEALEGFVSDHTERMKAIELLEQRVVDRTRKLSALYDILEIASDPSDLKTTIRRSLRRVLKAIKGNVGAIHLFDKTGEVLQLVAQKDLPEASVAKFVKISVQESMLAGWVVRNNKSLLIPKMSEDERTTDLAESSGLDVYIGVPIVANDLVQGALTVLSDDLSRYTAKEEMELLISVGEQLGVVVENARLRNQAEQLMVLEERNRLARELHDSVTQSLYSVTLFAEAGLNLTHSGEYDRVGQLFTDVLETGQQALKEMRLLVHKLRPSILEKEGLVRALQHRLKAVEGRAGIKNQLVVDGPLNVNPEVEEVLFHVAQEALNNALKHAHAAEVRVNLRQDELGSITLIVKDNGQGFELETAAEGSGLGLISMRERVEKLSGTISYQSTPGRGTEIQILLPVNNVGRS